MHVTEVITPMTRMGRKAVKKTATAVVVKKLAPSEEVDESPQLLYRPIAQQLTPDTIPFGVEYPLIDARAADELLTRAESNPEFRQRPRTPKRKEHWLNLMKTGRFVHFLPDGPLLMNGQGYLLNGGNRLAAARELDEPVGFVLVKNVPTWMVHYFDTGDKRSLREALIMRKRDVDGTTSALARLGMRYEEFLYGKRASHGWATWGRHRDEHMDVDSWIERRAYVQDWVLTGKRLQRATQLMNVSGACFVAYQHLAWPEGADKVEQFMDGLILGEMLSKGNPALTLREWGRKDGYIGEARAGRREGHLLLLFKMFASFASGSKVTDILVAKGFPMSMPYHPKGSTYAVANVREALEKMDAEAAA